MDDVIEGTAVDAETGAALAVVEVLMPATPQAAKAAMDAYQATTQAILDKADWQGTPGAKGSFVKKSGWRKIAKSYGLSTEVVSRECEHDEHGNPVRADAIVRAIHVPSGQYAEADGYCSADEPRFERASGRQKLENDLRTTAVTRAKNRAISDLVGMGAVSAEEVSAGEPGGPSWATEEAGTATKRKALDALNATIGHRETAVEYVQALTERTGVLPDVIAKWLVALPQFIEAGSLRAQQEAGPEEETKS